MFKLGLVLIIMFLMLLLIALVHLDMFGSKVVKGKRYSNLVEWYSSFECGFLNHGLNEKFFSFSYLNLLMLFVVFDLEMSLLLKMVYDGMWYYTFWCYFFFFFFLFFGYLMELKFGYMKWVE